MKSVKQIVDEAGGQDAFLGAAARCPDCDDCGFVSDIRDGVLRGWHQCSHPNRGKAAQEALALEANQEGNHGG